ncbi:hypothetical protein [Methanobrevibacter curvatus]|uniref:Uncharacterized protein n=1 Tax=Methanobrevibacter curvatus TaxID=49547 RepID=A0A166CIY7_9EURY|nr:hypothetical protein [Methanobrevibacter curvatus]KZX14561.1 hypothetical protein MBCUR_04530 [Methanobrevibacter curvatus]
MIKINNVTIINRGASQENITTVLNINNKIVNKTETIGYNGSRWDPNGFELIQSFAIVKNKVTNDMVRYWVNQNVSYPVGPLKASYGTFLTGLTTIWLSDKLADLHKAKFNVTWDRNSSIFVMAGVNNVGGAYIHIPDATMGMKIKSNNESNIIGFKFINSIFLSEIEGYALNLTGNPVNSAFDNIMNAMINYNFSIIREGDLVIILAEDGSNSLMVINTTSGLVKCFVVTDKFAYKGALSGLGFNIISNIVNTFWCFHNQLTNNLINNINNLLNNIMSSLNPVAEDLMDFFSTFSKINISNFSAFTGQYAFDTLKLVIGIGGLTCSSPLIFLGGLSLVLIAEGEFIVHIRDGVLPADGWQYISYHPSGIFGHSKTFVLLNKVTHKIDYIEVPFKGNWEYDRDNAMYIDAKTGARKLSRVETYKYFSRDYGSPWDWFGSERILY